MKFLSILLLLVSFTARAQFYNPCGCETVVRLQIQLSDSAKALEQSRATLAEANETIDLGRRVIALKDRRIHQMTDSTSKLLILAKAEDERKAGIIKTQASEIQSTKAQRISDRKLTVLSISLAVLAAVANLL